MAPWTDVVAEKPDIRFPTVCPSGLSQRVDVPVTVSSQKASVAFNVFHCSRCAQNIVRWQHFRALVVVGSLVAGSTSGVWRNLLAVAIRLEQELIGSYVV